MVVAKIDIPKVRFVVGSKERGSEGKNEANFLQEFRVKPRTRKSRAMPIKGNPKRSRLEI